MASPRQVAARWRYIQYAVLAIQGTQSDEVLAALGLPAGHDYMTFVEGDYDNAGAPITRGTEIRPGVKGVLGKQQEG